MGEGEQQTSMEVTEEVEVEEMELRKLDLDAIKAECGKTRHGYVSRRQIELLQGAIIRTRAH